MSESMGENRNENRNENSSENLENTVPAAEVFPLKQERNFCSGLGLCYAIFIAVTSAVQLAIGYAILQWAPGIIVNHFWLYMLVSMMPTYVIGFPILAKLCKNRPVVVLEEHKMRGGQFMALLCMCYGVMVIGNILGIVVNGVIGIIKGSPVVNSINLMLGNSNLWVNILIAGICAPIFEELMFRKFLVDRMVRYGEAVAVVVSGLMFGLFHGNFSQCFYAAFLGMLLAYAYVKTGKIKYPIFIHMIINLSNTLLLPVLQKIGTVDFVSLQEQMLGGDSAAALSEFAATLPYLIILVVYEIAFYGMAIAGVVLLIARRKRFTFKPGKVTIPKGKGVSVVWCNVGMLLFTLACIALFVMNLRA